VRILFHERLIEPMRDCDGRIEIDGAPVFTAGLSQSQLCQDGGLDFEGPRRLQRTERGTSSTRLKVVSVGDGSAELSLTAAPATLGSLASMCQRYQTDRCRAVR
jgi:hypothetical protein